MNVVLDNRWVNLFDADPSLHLELVQVVNKLTGLKLIPKINFSSRLYHQRLYFHQGNNHDNNLFLCLLFIIF